MPIHQLHSSQD